MGPHIHYIVARSRHGWSVNVDSDRLSDHADLESARAEAAMLIGETQGEDAEVSVVDLSDRPEGDG